MLPRATTHQQNDGDGSRRRESFRSFDWTNLRRNSFSVVYSESYRIQMRVENNAPQNAE